MRERVGRLLPARRGHFRFESGHHGERWLELERLCLDPKPVQDLAACMAKRLEPRRIEVVCGPLVEGAFVALMVASDLGVPFTYAERVEGVATDALYPMAYRLPIPLRDVARGRRVAIVNDVVNAGSAVRATWADLEGCGARPVAVGALAILGDWASGFAAEKGLALEALAAFPSALWTPGECPLCARGVPLES
ncbi:MAG: orotate phosphoribosyltransferase [Vicinamibacteria bacterium]